MPVKEKPWRAAGFRYTMPCETSQVSGFRAANPPIDGTPALNPSTASEISPCSSKMMGERPLGGVAPKKYDAKFVASTFTGSSPAFTNVALEVGTAAQVLKAASTTATASAFDSVPRPPWSGLNGIPTPPFLQRYGSPLRQISIAFAARAGDTATPMRSAVAAMQPVRVRAFIAHLRPASAARTRCATSAYGAGVPGPRAGLSRNRPRL